MAKQRKKAKSKDKRAQATAATPEIQAADFFTVGWAMSVFTGLLFNVGAAVSRMFVGPEWPRLAILAGYLLLAAAGIGLLSLVLMFVVLRVSRPQPPRGFTIFAILNAAAPLAAIVALSFR